MAEFLSKLFDHSDFTPRANCGNWSDELIWLHTFSDVAIWLAYLSIPVALVVFVGRRTVPFRGLVLLFAAFIVACGFTHLLDALMFRYPMYRLGGLVRAVTAVVSWVTVLALIRTVPKALAWADRNVFADAPIEPAADAEGRTRAYIVAVLAAVLALLVRAAFDNVMHDDHLFVLPLLAVVAVAWYAGFWPAVVTLFAGGTAFVFFFVKPRYSFVIADLGDVIATGLYLFCGLAAALLGEAQRAARRAADAAAREAADALAQLETFLAHAPVGIAFYDPTLQNVRVNKYLADANRVPPGGQMGLSDEVLPQFPADLVAEFRGVVASGRPLQNRVVYTRPDDPGGSIWETSAYPVRGADEQTLGLVVVAADVTARVRSAERLLDSEARLRAFIDNSPGSMYVKDAAGRYTLINRGFQEQVGRPANEILRKTDAEIFPPELATHFAGQDAVIRAQSRSMSWEDSFSYQGNPYTFLTAKFPLSDGAVGGIGTDLTDRKRAEQALRYQLRLTRTITDNATTAIFMTDARGRCTFANPAAEAMTGFTFTELDGRVLHDTVHHTRPDGRPYPKEECPLDRALPEHAEVRGHEDVFVRKSGAFYPVVCNARAIAGDGDGSGTVIEVRDVTAEKFLAGLAEATRGHRRPDDVLGEVVARTGRQFRATRCMYAEIDTDRNTLTVAGDYTDGAASAAGVYPLGGFSPAGLAELRAGKTFVVADAEADPRTRNHLAAFRAIGVRALLVVPLVKDGRLVAELILNQAAPRDWNPAEAWLLEQVAERAWAAVEAARAEAAAGRSEEQFRRAVEDAPIPIIMHAEDGQVLQLNTAWTALTGYTAADIPTFEAWLNTAYGDGADALRSAVRALFRGDAPMAAADFDIVTRAGDRRTWAFSASSPGMLRDGRRFVVGMAVDVTDRKLAEQTARDVADQFQTMADSIPQLAWMTDPDGYIFWYNRRWYDFTGTTLDQMKGWGWQVVHDPAEVGRVTEKFKAHIAGGEVWEDTFPLRRHDGVFRSFLSRAIPIRDAAGKVVRWFGTNTDIEDQLRYAERLESDVRDRTADLRRQGEFLDAILENVTDGIVACDADGNLTLFNRATREFHGLGVEPVPAGEWADRYSLFRADGRTPLPADEIPLARAFHGERVRDAEMVIAPRAAPPRRLLASGQQLADAAGRRLGAVVSMRDVTEQRRAEDRERAAAAELRRSNEELEKFAYVASHDLQEPLRKIQAFGDRLGKRFHGQLGDDGRDYIDRMLGSAGRMRKLIDDLLAFSRITSKRQPFAPIDLNEVVRGVLSDLDYRLGQTGGRIDLGPLPTIHADPLQMRQLFQNLLTNALKFLKPGEPPLVQVTAVRSTALSGDADPRRPPRPGWRITVADNGIGFEQQYADRIFELFQRLHGRGEFEGTGIGLAICRKIVERHGGTIAARGRPGVGATFVIDFPDGANLH